jgi:AhpC/TSA family/Thiol:disulfide interchange protein DsbD, N-terminal
MKFAQQGLGVAAISYDSPAILKEFAERHKIDFPLVADPDSEIIRMFKVLNAEALGKEKGMAHPGFFYIDATGVVREKFFGGKETDRLTPSNVVGKLFPELTEEVTENVDAPHLKLTLEQSDREVVSGNQVSLLADVQLPPAVHVYAPEVKGYRPIALKLNPVSGVELSPTIYPRPKILYLEAIQEHVPVFEDKFRIAQDVKVTGPPTSERSIEITGELSYQACDDKVCYPPSSVPVTWTLRILPIDLKRSPEDIQHH